MPASVLSGLRMREAVIAQQQHILNALQAELLAYLAGAMHIDLEHDHWELDPAEGILTRQP